MAIAKVTLVAKSAEIVDATNATLNGLNFIISLLQLGHRVRFDPS